MKAAAAMVTSSDLILGQRRSLRFLPSGLTDVATKVLLFRSPERDQGSVREEDGNCERQDMAASFGCSNVKYTHLVHCAVCCCRLNFL
jgi:hypothetical protein